MKCGRLQVVYFLLHFSNNLFCLKLTDIPNEDHVTCERGLAVYLEAS